MFPEEGKMSHASRSRGGQPPDLPDDSAALPADPVPDVPEVPPAPSPRRPSRHGPRPGPVAPRPAGASLRAGAAQPALTDGPFHLRRKAAEPPRLPRGLHG